MSKVSGHKTCYLTTTLPYVNSDPHIGFALEIVQADIWARSQKLQGKKVFFNTGTDEHGVKIYRKAQEEGKEVQAYVDEYAEKFKNLKGALGLLPEINFIRTTDKHHLEAAQEFWKKCESAGDIYKKNYKIKYCVGCELEKTDSELVADKCPVHPNLKIEIIDEENYFFRFSKYRKSLLDLYDENPNFTVPASRQKEIKAFVSRGLEDFSISRLKSKMPWGVPVPGDEEHVMFVWFDALVNYVSAIGWPASAKAPAGNADKEGNFEKWWPVVQFAGKDNLRQQSAMWQAMLMSAGLPASKQIVIHGFITSGGQKMSKSLGNVIDPLVLTREYGINALRYFLARHVHPFEDTDVTLELFKDAYNANLANGLGNLVSRVLKMATTNGVTFKEELLKDKNLFKETEIFYKANKMRLEAFDFQKSANAIWDTIAYLDGFIQKEQPFKKIKTDKSAGEKDIEFLLAHLFMIATMLEPVMPETAQTIQNLIKKGEMPSEPLFPRKD